MGWVGKGAGSWCGVVYCGDVVGVIVGVIRSGEAGKDAGSLLDKG